MKKTPLAFGFVSSLALSLVLIAQPTAALAVPAGIGAAAGVARTATELTVAVKEKCSNPDKAFIDMVQDEKSKKKRAEVVVFLQNESGEYYESGCAQFGITPKSEGYAKATQICTSCINNRQLTPQQQADEMAKLMAQIADKEAACADGKKPGSQPSTCGKDLGCNVMRSVSRAVDIATAGGAAALKKMLNKEPAAGSCMDPKQGDCLTEFIAGVVKDLIMQKNFIKDAGKWIWKKVTFQKDPAVQKQESKSSDAMHAACNQEDGFFKKFMTHPISTLGEFASAMKQYIYKEIGDNFGCAKWSGLEHFSKCERHYENYACANCNQIAKMFCGTAGFLGGELVTNFLTGRGLMLIGKAPGAAKAGALFAQTFGKAAKPIVTGAQAIGKLVEKHKALKTTASAISAVGKGAWKGVKGVGTVTGARWYLRKMDEAFMMGMVGKKAMTATKVAEAGTKVAAAKKAVGDAAQNIDDAKNAAAYIKSEANAVKGEKQIIKANKLTDDAVKAGNKAEKLHDEALALQNAQKAAEGAEAVAPSQGLLAKAKETLSRYGQESKEYKAAMKAAREAEKAEQAAEKAAKAAGKVEAKIAAQAETVAGKELARDRFLNGKGPTATAVTMGDDGVKVKAVSAADDAADAKKAEAGTNVSEAEAAKAAAAQEAIDYEALLKKIRDGESKLTQKDRKFFRKYRKQGRQGVDYYEKIRASLSATDPNFARLCGPGVRTCAKQDDVITYLLREIEKQPEVAGDFAKAKAYIVENADKCMMPGK